MAKMIIVKGREFSCKFIIKATGCTTPVELQAGDTGTITMSTTGPDPEVIISQQSLILGSEESMVNGEMSLLLTPEQTTLFPFDNQFGEDGFPLSATVKGILDIDTVSEGKIYALVPKIYIEDVGE